MDEWKKEEEEEEEEEGEEEEEEGEEEEEEINGFVRVEKKDKWKGGFVGMGRKDG